jgi:hypothetical protein
MQQWSGPLVHDFLQRSAAGKRWSAVEGSHCLVLIKDLMKIGALLCMRIATRFLSTVVQLQKNLGSD